MKGDDAEPRDYRPNGLPVRYPDPDIVQLDKRFAKYKIGNTPIQRLYALVLVLFAVLVYFTSRNAVFDAKALRDNPKNRRALLEWKHDLWAMPTLSLRMRGLVERLMTREPSIGVGPGLHARAMQAEPAQPPR